jgi:signal transduction histidine kinase
MTHFDPDPRRAGHQARESKTILVVDDDPSLREIVTLVLEAEGYRVVQADSGRMGLSLLQSVHPDLILSDVIMPGLDGYEFCERVRSNREWAQIPFIFLTARGRRTDVRRGMTMGADDYLAKPFEPEDLLSAVLARLAREAERQAKMDKMTVDLRETIIGALNHEFRTPLALVIGYAELLEQGTAGTSDEDFHDFLQGLREGVQRLRDLVEAVLLISKLQTGSLAQEARRGPGRTPEPDDLVRLTARQFEDQAQVRRVSLRYEWGAPQTVIAANAEHVHQIVSRLIDNAIKFSKLAGGEVLLKTSEEEGHWRLDVSDTGIGIREEALSWIFEAFRQVDRQRLEQQGVGLGLPIARGLAELYGGRLEVDSTLGEGSTFTAYLPLVPLDDADLL